MYKNNRVKVEVNLQFNAKPFHISQLFEQCSMKIKVYIINENIVLKDQFIKSTTKTQFSFAWQHQGWDEQQHGRQPFVREGRYDPCRA